jgi:hypothetical protein
VARSLQDEHRRDHRHHQGAARTYCRPRGLQAHQRRDGRYPEAEELGGRKPTWAERYPEVEELVDRLATLAVTQAQRQERRGHE